jgi:hypothetical protein
LETSADQTSGVIQNQNQTNMTKTYVDINKVFAEIVPFLRVLRDEFINIISKYEIQNVKAITLSIPTGLKKDGRSYKT